MNKKLKKSTLHLLNIFLPLFTGFCIYLFSYGKIPFFEFFQRLFGIVPLAAKSNLFLFARNYLCDAFWTYSMYFSLRCFSKNNFSLTSICIGTGLLLEILQKIHFISGTFDYLDILFELIAVFTALSVNKFFLQKGE